MLDLTRPIAISSTTNPTLSVQVQVRGHTTVSYACVVN